LLLYLQDTVGKYRLQYLIALLVLANEHHLTVNTTIAENVK